MLVHKKKRVLVIRSKNPEHITATIPTAKTFEYRGATLVAVPHKLDEVRVLRNMGIKAPSPILYYYDWPRNEHAIKQPFFAQTETAAFFTYHPRAYCHNGLGSGKTLSSLWSYDYLRSIGERKRVLVVSTLSTLDRAWGDTIFEHFPHLTFSVLHGSKEKRLKLLNHDGLKVIGDAFAERPDIDMVIVDEVSEAARNAQTDRWKSLNEVVNKQPARMKLPPRHCIGLTATPVPNDPTDAWAQCRLITPDTVPPYFNRFKDMVMRQSGPYNWVPREGAMEIVHKVMQPAIRFSREECVDLPPTTYMTREVPLTPEQEKAYKSMQAKLKAEVDAGEVLAVNEAVKIMKLAQICAGSVLDVNGDEVPINCKPRLEETLALVKASQSKSIVFVPFVSSLNVVAEYLRQHKVRVGVIHGAVSKRDRDVIFSGFQKGNEYDVIVAIGAAMSHGLTLTAASTIIWYAPINRADIYTQANGRTVRPSQRHNTLIVHIEGTPLERKMYNRLQHKQSMQGLLLDLVRGSREGVNV
jgi:SNF2 family DNA or RNA helicase